jgi:hypothetical protein
LVRHSGIDLVGNRCGRARALDAGRSLTRLPSFDRPGDPDRCHRADSRCRPCLRIPVGTPDENDALLAALGAILASA